MIDSSCEQIIQETRVLTLESCLNGFIEEEKLSAHDSWYCPKCKQHQQANKKIDIWNTPKILIIHLKRFAFNGMWREKISTFCSFPLRGLDLTSFLPPTSLLVQPIYDLFAVVVSFLF